MPHTHFIEGEPGCRYAVDHGAVAIVVDALRASATAAMILHYGASALLVTREVDEARAAKEAWNDALLFGERGGLPPEGFDYGNSPQSGPHARGRRVVFTTTTGAGRLVSCTGAHSVYMGTTVNAGAVVSHAASHGLDIVVIPAGLTHDPGFDAQEDRAAAAYLARRIGWPVGEGAEACAAWQARVEAEGLPAVFASSPHGQKLARIGEGADVPFCAQVDLTRAVPLAGEVTAYGVMLDNAAPPYCD